MSSERVNAVKGSVLCQVREELGAIDFHTRLKPYRLHLKYRRECWCFQVG